MNQDISTWSFDQLSQLYEKLGKSFRACGRYLECSPNTVKKYYNMRLEQEVEKYSQGKAEITDIKPIIKISKNNKKLATKSISSELLLDPSKTRVAVLDIETSSLKSDFGIVICAVIHTLGTKEKYKVCAIDLNNKDLLSEEKALLETLNAELESYDCIVDYFGSRFDIPFIRTRSLYHGIQPLSKKKNLDLYFTVKRTTNPSTRRLERINDILRISEPDSSPDKTRLGMREWNGVVFNRDSKMLDYIIEHCIADVKILENAVWRFKDFLPDRIMRC